MASEYESVAALMAEVRELRELLFPFARAADAFVGRSGQSRLISTVRGDVCVDDLRRVREYVLRKYGGSV